MGHPMGDMVFDWIPACAGMTRETRTYKVANASLPGNVPHRLGQGIGDQFVHVAAGE